MASEQLRVRTRSEREAYKEGFAAATKLLDRRIQEQIAFVKDLSVDWQSPKEQSNTK